MAGLQAFLKTQTKGANMPVKVKETGKFDYSRKSKIVRISANVVKRNK